MAPFAFSRLILGALAVGLLGLTGWLGWTWWQGQTILAIDGEPIRIREHWRLGAAIMVAAFSLFGRLPVRIIAADRDDRPTGPVRSDGQRIESSDGASLWVERSGNAEGPVIIFTHGWGLDSTIWRYAREDLADRFQLVMWDLPGLGRSRRAPDGKVSLERYAQNLADLLLLSGDRPAILVGHSIGGMIIQTLLRDHEHLRGRIAGVVLLNTTYTNPLKTIILAPIARALQKPLIEPFEWLTIPFSPVFWLMNWMSWMNGSTHLLLRLGFGRFATRGQIDHCALLATRNPPAVQARGNLAMFNWDATGALADAPMSVMVVGGEIDIITRPEASRDMAAGALHSSLRLVEHVNHMGPLERADVYHRMISEFAQSVQPRATLMPDLDTPADDLAIPARPPMSPDPRWV